MECNFILLLFVKCQLTSICKFISAFLMCLFWGVLWILLWTYSKSWLVPLLINELNKMLHMIICMRVMITSLKSNPLISYSDWRVHLWNILVKFKGGFKSLSYILPWSHSHLFFTSVSVESLCPGVNFIPYHPSLYFHVYKTCGTPDNPKKCLQYHRRATVRDLEVCCQGFKDSTSLKSPSLAFLGL